MGVDWFRFQLKPGVDKHYFSTLIEQQFKLFIDCGFLIGDELDVFCGFPAKHFEQSDEIFKQYVSVCATMRELFEIDQSHENVCWRVYPITGCSVFPLEWKIGAQRTYLPEEVPSILDQWKNYTLRVLAGEYRAYLTSLYLFIEPVVYHKYWDALVESAHLTLEKTNAWARRSELKELVTRITAIPSLPSYPAPRWNDWQDRPDERVNGEVQQQYEDWLRLAGEIFELFREWNRYVPADWNLNSPYDVPYTLDDYLASIKPGTWFGDFLDWVDKCVEDKMGLWLDF